MTTKIVALGNALGNLVDFRLLPGCCPDKRMTCAARRHCLTGWSAGNSSPTRAFGANWLREALEAASIEAVIPPKSNRRFPPEFDREVYKWRHLIENFFGKLKEYRGIAMRSCKTDKSFGAFIAITATVIRLK